MLGFDVFCDTCGEYMYTEHYGVFSMTGMANAYNRAYNRRHECDRCKSERIFGDCYWGYRRRSK